MEEWEMIQAAQAYIKDIFRADCSGHDYFHSLRVFKMADRIAAEENADRLSVRLAALLHDVDDRKLSPETYAHKDRAVAFLKSHNAGERMIRSVCTIIGEISFAGTGAAVPQTIEGKCVQDADRLDALGAIGIARTFAYGGSRGREIHNPEVKPRLQLSEEEYYAHPSTSINHFYEKLFRLKELMNTETARRIAAHREEYMKGYLREFLKEWEGSL